MSPRLPRDAVTNIADRRACVASATTNRHLTLHFLFLFPLPHGLSVALGAGIWGEDALALVNGLPDHNAPDAHFFPTFSSTWFGSSVSVFASIRPVHLARLGSVCMVGPCSREFVVQRVLRLAINSCNHPQADLDLRAVFSVLSTSIAGFPC